MGDPGLRALGRAGRMERVAEQHEPGVRGVGLCCREARDATTERMAPDGDVRRGRHDEVEGGHGILGLALREVDRGRCDPAGAEALHERRHARCRAARAVSQEAPDRHADRVVASAAVRGRHRSWPGRVMVGREAAGASSLSDPTGGPCAAHARNPPPHARPIRGRHRRSWRSCSSRSSRASVAERGPRSARMRATRRRAECRVASRAPRPARRPRPLRRRPRPRRRGRPCSGRPSRSSAVATGMASACRSTAPAAAPSPARTRRRSSPTTTAVPRWVRSRARRASASWSCIATHATATKPLVVYGRRGPWTIDRVAATFPADAAPACHPVDRHGLDDDVAHTREIGRRRRPATAAPKPASLVIRGANSTSRLAAPVEDLHLRRVPGRAPGQAGLDLSAGDGHQRRAARDLPSRRRAGRDAVGLAARPRSRRRPSPRAPTRRGASDPASRTTTSSTTPRSQVYRGAQGREGDDQRDHRARPGAVLRSGSSDRERALPLGRRRGDREQRERLRLGRPAPIVAGAGQLPARLDRIGRRTGRSYDAASPYATWKTRDLHAGAAVGLLRERIRGRTSATLTALDLSRPRRLGPADQRHAHRRAGRRRSRATSSGRSSTPAGRRPIRCSAARSSDTRRSPDAPLSVAGVTDRAAGRAAPGPAPTVRTPDPLMVALPRRRVGHRPSTTTSSCSSGSPSSRSRRACRGRPSCASATASARRSGASIRRVVAAFDDDDRERLMADAGIVRNRAKIDATIGNAVAFLAIARRVRIVRRVPWRRMVPPPPIRLPPTAPCRRHPGHDAGLGRAVGRSQAARLPVRRLDDRLRLHAERRARGRPPARLLPVPRNGRDTLAVTSRRAWFSP